MSRTSDPYTSWHQNETALSHIQATSQKTEELLQFLKRGWLAKANGFYNAEIFWLMPLFPFDLQVNPESTNCYARDPSRCSSKTYSRRILSWKKSLPHPFYFPLILTRPFSLENDLPNYFKIEQKDEIESVLLKAALTPGHQVKILDVTKLVQSEKWMQSWKTIKSHIQSSAKSHSIDLSQLICIENVFDPSIGAIRILPLSFLSQKTTNLHYQTLLHAISLRGLSATLVELNREPVSSFVPTSQNHSKTALAFQKENFLSYLNHFKMEAPFEKQILVFAMISMLQELLRETPPQKWDEISKCQASSAIVHLSFHRIQETLSKIKKEHCSFLNTTSHFEEINCHLMALLEVLSPFSEESFQAIYSNILSIIPNELKPLSSYSLHASGMTSLAGILKATKQAIEKMPHVLYGENIYFETLHLIQETCHAAPLVHAQEEDWKNVDLILTQFNPVLKKDLGGHFLYHKENVEQIIHQVLEHNPNRSFTVAIDMTLDPLDSPNLAHLMDTFTHEIQESRFNLIFYKSGLKFDLFGLDHCAVAPFFMIQCRDPKWAPFAALCKDKALTTDHLSLNWLSLAYKAAFPFLQQYREHIFKNTKTLLETIPKRLFDPQSTYRVVSFEDGAESSFIDIRIFGALHSLKAAMLGGSLYLNCMKSKYPVFWRRSFGFFHPNFGMLFGEKSSTIRLTLGLDPAQIDMFRRCLIQIDSLNAPKISKESSF